MHSLLDRFVRGNGIRIGYDMKELGSSKPREDMRGYFEFRSMGRMTETRLFGFFARPGAFVATDFKARNEFGDKDDPRWLAQREACEARWRGIAGDASYLTTPWPVRLRSQLMVYLEQCDD